MDKERSRPLGLVLLTDMLLLLLFGRSMLLFGQFGCNFLLLFRRGLLLARAFSLDYFLRLLVVVSSYLFNHFLGRSGRRYATIARLFLSHLYLDLYFLGGGAYRGPVYHIYIYNTCTSVW